MVHGWVAPDCKRRCKHCHSRSPRPAFCRPRLSSKILDRLVSSKRAIKLKDSQISQIQEAKCCEKSPDLMLDALRCQQCCNNANAAQNAHADSCSNVDCIDVGRSECLALQLRLWIQNDSSTILRKLIVAHLCGNGSVKPVCCQRRTSHHSP